MTQTPEADIDLRHYLEIAIRRRLIIVSVWLATVLASFFYALTMRHLYQASALLNIEKGRDSTMRSTFANGVMVASGDEDYYQTQYHLLQSNSLTQKVYDALNLSRTEEFKPPFALEKLHKAVQVAPIPRSRLVHVRVKSRDPKLAADIANAIAETFTADNLGNQLFMSRELLQTLQSKEQGPAAQRIYESLPAVVNNDLIQTLRAEYIKLQAEAAEMSQKVTPRHPAMISLANRMDTVQRQIRTETDKVVQSLKTELSGQLQGNNVRIIDRAETPLIPIWPNKKKTLLLGFMAGLVLGYGLAVLVDLVDQTLRTQEDVEKKLGRAFLGVIPQLKIPIPYRDILAQERSLTGEAFRNLRTMVDFAKALSLGKATLVTSSVQEEGKTYVSTNLAVTMTQLGESVLLIDGDLRRPKLHKVFSLSSESGLSNFLAKGAHADELESLVQATDVPGLSVLPCGVIPPNPSELLNTPRLGALLAWTQERFDRVIIDCTPLFPISDTLLWQRHVTSCVLIVRYGKTRVPLVKNACQRLESAGGKILGIVVNATKARGLAYNSYGYYYQQYYHDYRQPVQPSARA